MIINTTEGSRQDVSAPLALHNQRHLSCPRKRMIPAQRWETKEPRASCPGLEKGIPCSSLTCAPAPLGSSREGEFHPWGDPQALTGGSDTLPPNRAVDRGHQAGQAPPCTPKGISVPQHPLAAAVNKATCHFPQV